MNYHNEAALRLYERAGFVYERSWRVWRRSGFLRAPASIDRGLRVSRLRQRDWQAEYALAQAARPNGRGGLGWLKPVHRAAFSPSLWRRLGNLIALNSVEKMVVYDEDGTSILASCWVEGALSFGNVRAWLFTDPAIDHRPQAAALLDWLVSRFDRATILFEHPSDDEIVNGLLKAGRFTVTRDLWHMRLDL